MIIEKGIEMPSNWGTKGHRWVDILRQMEVGDSIEFGADKKDAGYVAASRNSKNGLRFVVRRVGQTQNSWRLFRVA